MISRVLTERWPLPTMAGRGRDPNELEGSAVSVHAVVFDIGETLLDDTREYAAWADWIGIPRHTFSAVLGAITADGPQQGRDVPVLPARVRLGQRAQGAECGGIGAAFGGEVTAEAEHVRPGGQPHAFESGEFAEADAFGDVTAAWSRMGRSASWSAGVMRRSRVPVHSAALVA